MQSIPIQCSPGEFSAFMLREAVCFTHYNKPPRGGFAVRSAKLKNILRMKGKMPESQRQLNTLRAFSLALGRWAGKIVLGCQFCLPFVSHRRQRCLLWETGDGSHSPMGNSFVSDERQARRPFSHRKQSCLSWETGDGRHSPMGNSFVSDERQARRPFSHRKQPCLR